eukprot:CAMPEP_0170481744 /NCGR_PEP_ID=MMETSP0208-20121228/2068_1 /TAXON_ID=197538 /ORGANISM="Strombidium inclinatum, Strain S3" /LENGTH=56 /DNA_ID=CAMNT_0010754499 /DNA_START=50 /DNA_END=220 /DNA_ORIENTATION=-
MVLDKFPFDVVEALEGVEQVVFENDVELVLEGGDESDGVEAVHALVGETLVPVEGI